jgi:hypothetical protein
MGALRQCPGVCLGPGASSLATRGQSWRLGVVGFGPFCIDNLAPITLSTRLHKRAALYRGIRVGTRVAAGTGMHVECAKRREGKG